MSDTAIVKSENSLVTNVQDLQAIAQVFIKSGFFQDIRDMNQAQVKIMAGREIGLEPFASMSGIHVIKGKVTYGANVQAAKVKGSGRYDYRVKEMTDKACRVMFLERVDGKWVEIGMSEFTIEDARKAGTQNTDKFPRNMLFARAISNGVKWFCPDVTSGVTMYAPEEFGAVVDDGGQVVSVDGQAVESHEEKVEPELSEYGKACEQKFTKAGKEYKVGDIENIEQLKWLAENAQNENVRNAARIVYDVKFDPDNEIARMNGLTEEG